MVREEAFSTAKGTAIGCSTSVVGPTAIRSSLPSQWGFLSRSAFSRVGVFLLVRHVSHALLVTMTWLTGHRERPQRPAKNCRVILE